MLVYHLLGFGEYDDGPHWRLRGLQKSDDLRLGIAVQFDDPDPEPEKRCLHILRNSDSGYDENANSSSAVRAK